LYAIAVRPDVQGKQVGRRLAEHTLSTLASLGISRVYLEVRSDNESAIALYRKLGFRDHQHLPKYYGPGRDALRMKLARADADQACSGSTPFPFRH
jgi:ribosomal-protein-alanine N-acetyltransferase